MKKGAGNTRSKSPRDALVCVHFTVALYNFLHFFPLRSSFVFVITDETEAVLKTNESSAVTQNPRPNTICDLRDAYKHTRAHLGRKLISL